MDKKNNFFLKLKNYKFENKIPSWQFGVKNAYLVVYAGVSDTNIYNLLTTYIFEGDLCMHKSVDLLDKRDCEEFNILYLRDYNLENYKFFNAGLSQKEYYLQYIPIYSNYKKFIESAFFYYLKFKIENDELSDFIRLIFGVLIVNNTISSFLYNHLVNLNIFSLFTPECLDGLFFYYTDWAIITSLTFVFKEPNAIVRAEKNMRIFRAINAFSFYFSPKFRSTCFKDCIETESYIPMFIALKVYQIKLKASKLTLNELKKVEILSSFKQYLIDHNRMSEENIDKLIEKNWSYNKYE